MFSFIQHLGLHFSFSSIASIELFCVNGLRPASRLMFWKYGEPIATAEFLEKTFSMSNCLCPFVTDWWAALAWAPHPVSLIRVRLCFCQRHTFLIIVARKSWNQLTWKLSSLPLQCHGVSISLLFSCKLNKSVYHYLQNTFPASWFGLSQCCWCNVRKTSI